MRLIAPFVVLAAVLVAAVYWDDPAPEADLVFVSSGDAFTLDPQRMSYVKDFRLAYALYEGLLRWNNHDLSIEPAAAALPEVSADQITYTFSIRPDARWSNGDPVTAHDFVYAWMRLLWPDTAADYSNLFFVIEGAEDFFRWRSAQLAAFATHAGSKGVADAISLYERALLEFQKVGIAAIDDRTLQVRLRQPTPYFLDLVCFAVCYPVHRPSVEGWPDAAKLIDRERGWIGVAEPAWQTRRYVRFDAATGRLQQEHGWARPGRLVSNGPYVLAEWRYKRDLRLERNLLYHSQEIIRNNSALMLAIEDVNTTVLAFNSGKIDWVVDVNAEYVPDMIEEKNNGHRRDIHAMPAFGADFYSFNCRPTLADGRPNPFADARVRRAFALAVDKSAIVNRVTRRNEPVLNVLIPPGSIRGYESPAGLAFDAGRARAELRAAGWMDRDGDGLIENERRELFPVVDLLWTTSTPRYRWISLELKAQWERTLGVQIQLRSADTKFYKEDLKLGKFMIARGSWYGDYGDPTTFLDINRTGDGNNDRGFSDSHFDSLLDQAAQQSDPNQRMATLHQAERYLFQEQLPLIPICQLVQFSLFDPQRVNGISSHPRLVQYLWQIELDE